MSRNTVVQDDDAPRLAIDWRNGEFPLKKYSVFSDEFISMLTEYHSIRYRHLGRISAARYFSKLAHV